MSRSSHKKPMSHSSKQMAIIYFAIMAMGMGQTVVFAVIPMLGRELGLDLIVLEIPRLGISFQLKELAITSLTSLSSLVYFLTAPYWGRRSDVVGRKQIIIIGLVGYAIGTVAFNSVAHLGLLGVVSGFVLYTMMMAARVLVVMVMSATQPAASAYTIDVTPLEKRIKGMSRLGAASQIGTMVGPALAYFSIISFLAPLYIQAGLTLLAAILVFLYLDDDKKTSSSGHTVSKLSYLDPRFRVYLGVGLVMFTMMGMVQQTLGFYFQDKLNLDGVAAAQQFSIAMVISSTMMLAAQFLVVQNWPGHPIRLLQMGLPVTAIGYVCLAMAGSLPWLLLGMGFFGLGMGMAMPGYSVTATYTVGAKEQGSLAGLSASAPAMGFVIGPVVGGLVYGYMPTLTYWCAAIVLVPLFLFTLLLKVK